MDTPILVFQTDFTYQEGAVAAMYGVVKSVEPGLEIMDATHQIRQYDIWSASYRLRQYMDFWPRGTVFVSVVDPGVGTARRACVARTKSGMFIVTPDNGTLTHALDTWGIEAVREIDETVNRLRGHGTEGVAVFHGRDVFAYCAARLAAGHIDFAGVGRAYPVSDIVSLPLPQPGLEDGAVCGFFEIGDPNFGNLWTNIPLSLFHGAGFRYGDTLRMTVTHGDTVRLELALPFHPAFGHVSPGQPVIYGNELSRVAVALCQGSMMAHYNLDYGYQWKVRFTR